MEEIFFFFFFFWTRLKEKNLNLLLKIIINNKSHRWRKTALTTARGMYLPQSPICQVMSCSIFPILRSQCVIWNHHLYVYFHLCLCWLLALQILIWLSRPITFSSKTTTTTTTTNKQTKKKTPRCHNISKLKYCTIEVHQYIWNCSLMM